MQNHSATPESHVAQGREILLGEGPGPALQYLAASEHVSSQVVRRAMWAIASTHHRRLSSLLDDERFDPVWSQCSVCDSVWMLSPLHAQTTAGSAVTCAQCRRVLCPQCARTAGPQCACGGSYTRLTEPNGRKRRKAVVERREQLEEWLPPPPDRPLESQPDLHLYFGFDGRVPVGIDTTFVMTRTADSAGHLAWAAMLCDAGLFHHGRQQLQLVDEPSDPVQRAKWLYLHARLDSVRLRNAHERRRRRERSEIANREWSAVPERIRERLEAAVAADPTLGPAWLLAAEVCLDPLYGVDAVRALQCAEQAALCAGRTSAVRFVLGKALCACGRPAEAVEALADPPADDPRTDEWRRELHVARLEARCATEPMDVDAHFTLGRWYQRRLQNEKALRLFTRLVELRPERAEGYCGLAWMAFLDYDRAEHERIAGALQLCREALARNPELGAAYEILGALCWRARHADPPVEGPPGEPLDYYRRAVALDPTCDAALEQVAEDHMEHGRWQEALTLLEQAMALDTAISTVYAYAALLCQGLRRWDEQDRAQRRAVELEPDRALSEDYRARILKRCGFEF